MLKHLKVLSVIVLACYLCGCATVTTGVTQKVPIDSNPQGANVTTNTGHKGITPCSLKLERSKAHIITLSKQGYKTAQIVLTKTMCGSTAGNAALGVCAAVLTNGYASLIVIIFATIFYWPWGLLFKQTLNLY